ncbi:hypothetical protein A3740_18445 [Oleiphilus sp. HI0068]|nr:hypothetical protein A3740_18445 [Oleiphilus sp. HI0068]KZY84352.1 hypothetical protein A3741_16210 [Oleiphilus sp. HI0069]
MRQAKVEDAWRHIGDEGKYNSKLLSAEFCSLTGFLDEFKYETTSAITSICGKNGVGKTTLLKALYEALTVRNESHIERLGEYLVQFDVKKQEESFSGLYDSGLELEDVHYLDPTRDCSRIIEFLRTTTNTDELLEGLEANRKFEQEKFKKEIQWIIGKQYKEILFYEIEGAMDDDYDYVFPIFYVESSDGVKYSNLDMGMGELASLYIVWFFEYVERQSIVFLEEPENFISAYSQRNLMSYLASQSFGKKIWLTLSTHSEHILSMQSNENIRVLSQNSSGITKLIKPVHSEKYLSLLGAYSART